MMILVRDECGCTDTGEGEDGCEEREKEEKAERWRACPSLLREECTMIGLGVCCIFRTVRVE